MSSFLLFTLATVLGLAANADREPHWTPVGPTGGHVRTLASDPDAPHRVYLGTPDGLLYRSEDGGRSWLRLSPGFPRRDCSLDEIVVDDRGVVYVGFWEVHGKGGGVARSTDRGATFEILQGMDGQSVRALAIAPTNRRVIAAGTLTGVFLSNDAGEEWKRITPEGDPDLRNVGSLAFDPVDARILYAGTWHLAWKTPDAGAHWQPIHRGMIDDSDVMTLNIDSRYRRNLYATACNGIYHSTDAGANWTKLEGIPESSRRTRSFRRSPDDVDLLLAGTTEGLWISHDRGAKWRRATPKEWVINSIVLGPDGSILLGTEQEGVVRSEDGGANWISSNDGFAERFVKEIVFDDLQSRVLVAVWGARTNGGVFVAPDVRGPWTAWGHGLDGRQVLSLSLLGTTALAGTDDGVFARGPEATAWTRVPTQIEGREIHPRVTELIALPSGRLIAATPRGLLLGSAAGRSWKRVPLGDAIEILALARCPSDPSLLVTATRAGFWTSRDGGTTWNQVSAQSASMTPHALAFVPSDQSLLATTSSGLFRSTDQGSTWQRVSGGIPHSDLTGLAIHPDGHTILASDFTRGGIFRSVDGGTTWSRMTTRGLASDRVWTLGVDPQDPRRLVAASPAGGLHLLVQATTADSPMSQRHSAPTTSGVVAVPAVSIGTPARAPQE